MAAFWGPAKLCSKLPSFKDRLETIGTIRKGIDLNYTRPDLRTNYRLGIQVERHILWKISLHSQYHGQWPFLLVVFVIQNIFYKECQFIWYHILDE